MGFPISRVKFALTVSKRSSSRRAAVSKTIWRCIGVFLRHISKPALLLSNALSKSFTLACGTWPISEPSAGQITGSDLPEDPLVQSPAINIFIIG